ncbi:hypothetical protein ACJIZ3_002384 [Penstemon smallii]|uniref:Uncharacterized protein n=1 Tax=Penstemon smallii TaxID=265156 RepID=A0ABD3U853_9LAMI
METPSSTRRITRSQTAASASAMSRKTEESEKAMTKSYPKTQNQDRSALIDITNDSPIVGLAMGNLNTPTSAMSKKRTNSLAKFTRTPGSGEALLRGQVKTLLQKVEEEAEFSKITIENRPILNLQGISLVAPTPANTPQILDVTLPSVNEKIMIPLQMVNEMIEENGIQSENFVTRSLLMDFSEKSESSDCSSVVTYQDSGREKLSSTDDDNASIWSIQVNASSTHDEEEEFEDFCEEEFEKNNFDGEEEEIEEDYGSNDVIIDELCEGISKISVVKFTGKHIRFVYNSDDELQGEERVPSGECETGKGIRFCLELEEEI